MNTKKSPPQSCPPGMLAKMLGIVMKISPGPALGSMPYAKQAGIIINPAISATSVSSAVMRTHSPVRALFLSMYDPNIIIEPTPSDSVKNAWLIAANITLKMPVCCIALKSGIR